MSSTEKRAREPDTGSPKGPQESGGQEQAGTQQEQGERLVRQRALSDNLRTIFHGIADEPVPSTMLSLLDELESKAQKK